MSENRDMHYWKTLTRQYAEQGPQQARAVEEARQQAMGHLTDNPYDYWETVYTLAQQAMQR